MNKMVYFMAECVIDTHIFHIPAVHYSFTEAWFNVSFVILGWDVETDILIWTFSFKIAR